MRRTRTGGWVGREVVEEHVAEEEGNGRLAERSQEIPRKNPGGGLEAQRPQEAAVREVHGRGLREGTDAEGM